MPQINQQRLAKELNLSQTTVSRALGNHPSINADTKAQVWNLAAQLGYKITSSTKTRSSRIKSDPIVIGILIAIPKKFRGQAETSQMVLRGIAERSSSEAVTLDILYQEPSAHNLRAIQKRMRQSKWKGCILVHPMASDVVDLISKTVPCVSVVENYGKNFIDSVDVDQIESVGSIVRRLHENGHRKIGFLSWVYDVPTPWVYHRFGAYVENLFKLGLDLSKSRIINIEAGEELNPEEVSDRVIHAIEHGTTAFVCAADHQAYDIQEILQKRGLKIPEQCTLTGFDGLTPPNGSEQVPTIRVPYDEIGRSTFHQLLHRIEFPTAPRRHVLVDGEPYANDRMHKISKYRKTATAV